MSYLLLITVLYPLARGLLLGLGEDRDSARRTALITTLMMLAFTVVLVASYPGPQSPSDSQEERTDEFAASDFPWLEGSGAPVDVSFSIALDGLSLWLFALTSLLMVVAVLVSWQAIRQQQSLFYRLLLFLETGMLGVFVARDIILFYIFFEFTLIPLFFLIGIWGSEDRRHAAAKFFYYTLAGSVMTFLGLLAIVLWDFQHSSFQRMTFSIPELTAHAAYWPIDANVQCWIFLALFAGFAIKVPLFPLHTWLPLAHVQAPTAGSVILAGVLLKVGTYGFLRFNLPLLPDATAAFMPWLLGLSVAGIIYGALLALAQSDIKRLVAYSSVSHLGFCMLGIFAANRWGIQGGVLQMISHGLATGGLFALVGMIYERYHTRQIADLGGLARRMPVMAFFMLVLTLASIGLPGLSGFAGEFMILLGMFQRAWTDAPPGWSMEFRAMAVLAAFGVVLGAWYMLQLVQRVFFGPLREPKPTADAPEIRDLGLREVAALSPLVVMIVWIGLWPQFFLDRMAPTLNTPAYGSAPPSASNSQSRLEGWHVPERSEGSGTIPSTPIASLLGVPPNSPNPRPMVAALQNDKSQSPTPNP
jgi:NADH-quinone oxidoreductase subunit M